MKTLTPFDAIFTELFYRAMLRIWNNIHLQEMCLKLDNLTWKTFAFDRDALDPPVEAGILDQLVEAFDYFIARGLVS